MKLRRLTLVLALLLSIALLALPAAAEGNEPTITGVTPIESYAYDGLPKIGYTGTPTCADAAEFAVYYYTADERELPGPPTEVGEYFVEIVAYDSLGEMLAYLYSPFTIVESRITGVTPVSSYLYDGQPKTGFTGTPRCIGADSFTYTYMIKDSTEPLSDAPTNIGDYVVRITAFNIRLTYAHLDIPFSIEAPEDARITGYELVDAYTYDGQPHTGYTGTPTFPGATRIEIDYQGIPDAPRGAGRHKCHFTVYDANGTVIDRLSHTFTINPAPLTWDTTGLETLSVKSGSAPGYLDVTGTVALSGVADGELTLAQPYGMESGYINAKDTATPGVIAVPVRAYNKIMRDVDWASLITDKNGLAFSDSPLRHNYILPEGDPTVKVTVTGGITGLTAVKSYTYDGQPHTGYTGTPTCPGADGYSITYDAEILSASFSPRSNVGTHSVTVDARCDGEVIATWTNIFTIEPAPLAWDISGIEPIQVEVGYSRPINVEGTLKLTGVVGDELEFRQPNPLGRIWVNSYETQAEGIVEAYLREYGGLWEINLATSIYGKDDKDFTTSQYAANYSLPDVIIIPVTVGDPAESPVDATGSVVGAPNIEVHLSTTTGVSDSSATALGDLYPSATAIEQAVTDVAVEQLVLRTGVDRAQVNVTVLDASAMFKVDGVWTQTWPTDAAGERYAVNAEFTLPNLTVEDGQAVYYTVSHMSTYTYTFGDKIIKRGEVERVEDDGIWTFTGSWDRPKVTATFTGLSPIAIAWVVVDEPAEPEVGTKMSGMPLFLALLRLHAREFAITATATEGGSITAEGVSLIRYRGSMTYTFAAAEGYRLATVIVDGKDMGAMEAYTFTKVNRKHSIVAVYEKIEEEPQP